MNAKNYDYDLLIIGGGSAGIVAGNVAGAVGARVALVEKNRIGGECLWTGCVPSKALLHAADVAHTIKHAASHGFADIALPRESCAGAFDYVRAKIEETRNNDATEKMLSDYGVHIFRGDPRFRDAHTVTTPGGDIKAAHILLAMGSRPAVPEIPGLADAGFLTNTTLFDLAVVPESVGVIGGGYIACEMGQSLARLGACVAIFERGERLLKRDDAEVVAVLTGALEADGVRVHANAKIVCVERDGDKRVVVLADGSRHAFAELLVTTGRVANTDTLDLHDIGVDLGANGAVLVDDYGKTSADHVYACGDVTGTNLFSHMAEAEAKAVVRNILLPGAGKVPRSLVPYAIFTSPEIARVGLTEDEAREKHGDGVTVLRHFFRQDDRAIAENQTAGLVKVVTVGTLGRIVGASIVGQRAGELIHEWVMAMHHNLPITAIADLVHTYPTLNVTNQRAAQKWYSGVMAQPIVTGALNLLGY
ncbi:MAG: FAD-dependent oxidoreductase, partial [Armatimonadetes bacterium]|nr:FAD-dependent oxidoreductase [Armatimonadota bacterium]